MRTYIAIIALIFSAPTAAQCASWVVQPDGAGPSRVGMSLTSVNRAICEHDKPPAGPHDPTGWSSETYPTKTTEISLSPPPPPSSTMGPLKALPSNRRYFMNGNGQATYLVGWYPAYNFQDNAWNEKTVPQAINFSAYLRDLKSHNLNHIRLWAVEHAKYSSVDLYLTSPMQWLRTGPGTANDGVPKFDLNQFDQAYFDRLRSRVLEAQSQGIYVTIMLFQGWSIRKNETGLDPWRYHPFNGDNNVNGINGDKDGDGQGDETHTLQIAAINSIQSAYVRKVIDTVNDLDNVLFEVANESPTTSKDWQYHMVSLIKTHEANKQKQHPVGVTSAITPNNPDLNASDADWISPGATLWSDPNDPWVSNPLVADGSKVSITDSDHIIGTDAILRNPSLARMWVWKSFTRGHNPINAGTLSPALGGDYNDPEATNPNWANIWGALGSTRLYAVKMNLALMTPQGGLTSTTFALANPGSEYIVYQPASEPFTLDLAAGTYSFEWFNPSTNSIAQTGSISVSSGDRSFSPPFSGDSVLYIKSCPPPPQPPPPPLSSAIPGLAAY